MKVLIENITVDTELRGERLLSDILSRGKYVVSAESIRLENPTKTLPELEQLRYQLVRETEQERGDEREGEREPRENQRNCATDKVQREKRTE
jgi:hypothetical protein